MTEPVVPIRPGVEMKPERTRKLLEHIAEGLVKFTADNNEEPESIAFVIIGMQGTFSVGYLIEDYWRAKLALAGAMLTGKSLTPDDV